jgi:hypothetical protein
MKKLAIAAVVVAQLASATPAHAQPDGRNAFVEDQRGGFVGLRIRARSGGQDSGVRAALTVAPTVHNRSGAAMRMDMGEGLELGASPGTRPTLTLAGQRLDQMSLFGEETDPDRQNLSTVAKVAIAAGVIVVTGVLVLGHIVGNASCFHGPRDCS